MPIELSNATYKAFTDFAAKVSDRTIAAFGDDKNSVKSTNGLDARTIVPSHNWDFIGNVGRLSGTRADNNAVRNLPSLPVCSAPRPLQTPCLRAFSHVCAIIFM